MTSYSTDVSDIISCGRRFWKVPVGMGGRKGSFPFETYVKRYLLTRKHEYQEEKCVLP